MTTYQGVLMPWITLRWRILEISAHGLMSVPVTLSPPYTLYTCSVLHSVNPTPDSSLTSSQRAVGTGTLGFRAEPHNCVDRAGDMGLEVPCGRLLRRTVYLPGVLTCTVVYPRVVPPVYLHARCTCMVY